MPNNPDIKKGDVILEDNIAYKVVEVKNKKNNTGKLEPHVFFKYVYETKDNKGVVASIPVSSLDQVTIKSPISKNKLNQVLKKLAYKPSSKPKISLEKTATALKANDIESIGSIMRDLTIESNFSKDKFSKEKQQYLEECIHYLTQAVSTTLDISSQSAKQKIANRIDTLNS
jgi:RNA polymerase-interacting CarD/CdnL/TRCF family regulator